MCAGVTAHINRDVALYTDADVLFIHEFDPCKLDIPEVIAIGPETDRVANSWSEMNWNAGVLLINLKGFAAVLPQMLQWANDRHWDFQVADQSMLNDFFPGVYGKPLDPLPEAYNWKAYWGCSPDIVSPSSSSHSSHSLPSCCQAHRAIACSLAVVKCQLLRFPLITSLQDKSQEGQHERHSALPSGPFKVYLLYASAGRSRVLSA